MRLWERLASPEGQKLNGDDITDADELETRVLEVVSLFRPKVAVHRLFIDEISAVPRWERALQRTEQRVTPLQRWKFGSWNGYQSISTK